MTRHKTGELDSLFADNTEPSLTRSRWFWVGIVALVAPTLFMAYEALDESEHANVVFGFGVAASLIHTFVWLAVGYVLAATRGTVRALAGFGIGSWLSLAAAVLGLWATESLGGALLVYVVAVAVVICCAAVLRSAP